MASSDSSDDFYMVSFRYEMGVLTGERTPFPNGYYLGATLVKIETLNGEPAGQPMELKIYNNNPQNHEGVISYFIPTGLQSIDAEEHLFINNEDVEVIFEAFGGNLFLTFSVVDHGQEDSSEGNKEEEGESGPEIN